MLHITLIDMSIFMSNSIYVLSFYEIMLFKIRTYAP